MKKYLYNGVLATLLLVACTHGEPHTHELDEENQVSSSQHNANEIVMSPEMIVAGGVVTDQVKLGYFSETLKTTGQILNAQGKDVTLVAPASGVVSFSRPLLEGSMVNSSHALLSLSSENLMDGSPAQRTRIAYETARKDFERASRLVEKQIISVKEFNSVSERYANARLSYEALPVGKDGRCISVKAPITGYVKSCMVNEGDFVSVGQPLLTVSQNQRLQLRAEVSERYLSVVSQIVTANFVTPYDNKVYAMEHLNGRRVATGQSLGPSSYYLPVTFEFNNIGDIIPGSFVEVYLKGKGRDGVISLPKSAITEEQGLNFVYVKLDEHCFARREVKLGMTDGDRYEILSGLRQGEEVVVSGAMHVKLASASHTIPGHTHNH